MPRFAKMEELVKMISELITAHAQMVGLAKTVTKMLMNA
mgnify:CR=1 FL=1